MEFGMKNFIALIAILLFIGEGQTVNLFEWLKDEDNKGLIVIGAMGITSIAFTVAATLNSDLIYQKGRSMYGGDAQAQRLATRGKHIRETDRRAKNGYIAYCGIGIATSLLVGLVTYGALDHYLEVS
jgi:hypothetical protein